MAFVISRPSLSLLQPRRPRSPSLALQPHPHSGWGAAHRRARRAAGWCCRAAPEGWGQQEPGWGSGDGDARSPAVGELQDLDLNQLQTALNVAIAAEDYELAAAIRDALQRVAGEAPHADWGSLGVLPWLAERAEYLGFRLPTEVQKRSTPVVLDRDDCIVQSETGSGKTLAFVLPLLSLLGYPPELYPDDLKGPQAVIVVPTRELGVQVVMLIYKLFGGSVNQGIPGEGGNIFNYSGPRGLKVKGLLLDEELEAGDDYLRGAHVVVGTPQLLAQALARPEGAALMQHTVAVAVDEVDACFQDHPHEMAALLDAACAQPQKPTMVFVGATMEEDLEEYCVAQRWLSDPVTVRVGARMRVPRGLSHRYMVVDEPRKLAAMARQIRMDLRGQGDDAAPARVIVFAASEAQAVALADPLRTVLWGDHSISVLLPHGTQPITALHSFRDNKATLLLATPAAARGLDLPAVSHVYNVSVPRDATEYLHRAGRAGRIGSPVPGIITTLVSPGEEEHRLLELAEELGLDLVREEEPAADALEMKPGEAEALGEGATEDLERLRSGLEDLFHMF